MPIVCVIDDDEAVRDSMQVLLVTRGMGVRTFASAKCFLAELGDVQCHCLLIDMHMPEMTGLALLVALRERGNHAPVIIVTGGGDEALSEQVQRAGAIGLLRKPVGVDELFGWIDRAIEAGGAAGCGAEAP